VKGAAVRAGALGIGVAADHELLPALALDLEPVARAPAPIRPVGLLGDDALEVSGVAGVEELLAALLDVSAVPEDAGAARDQQLQELLALGQRHVPEVVAVDLETVEEHGAYGNLPAPGRDVARVRQSHAALQSLERAAAVLVEGDDLAIEHGALDGQRRQRFDDLGIARGEVLAAAAGEGLIDERRQHDGLARRVHVAAGRTHRLQPLAQRVGGHRNTLWAERFENRVVTGGTLWPILCPHIPSAPGRSPSDWSRFPCDCTRRRRRKTCRSTSCTPSVARASASRRSARWTTRRSIAASWCAATSSPRINTSGSATTS